MPKSWINSVDQVEDQVQQLKKFVSEIMASLAAPDAAGQPLECLTFLIVHDDVPLTKQIDMLETDTLYNLMEIICHQLKPGNIGSVHAHIWLVKNKGTRILHCGPQGGMGYVEESPQTSSVLHELNLENGSQLDVQYDLGSSTCFSIVVVKKWMLSSLHADVKLLPRINEVQPLEGAAFLTDEEINISRTHRLLLETTPETEFSYSQNKMIKASGREWHQKEEDALTLLAMAGITFDNAWNELLQHTMLFRSKTSASGRYYKNKKETADLDMMHGTHNWLYGIGDMPQEKILEKAKLKLKGLRKVCLGEGPRIGTSPYHPGTTIPLWMDSDIDDRHYSESDLSSDSDY